MEMQFFILGHVILLAISVVVGFQVIPAERHGEPLIAIAVMFMLMELIYWVLHWYFVC